MVKKPKFDLTKLMELHSDSLKGDVGMEMARPEARWPSAAGLDGDSAVGKPAAKGGVHSQVRIH